MQRLLKKALKNSAAGETGAPLERTDTRSSHETLFDDSRSAVSTLFETPEGDPRERDVYSIFSSMFRHGVTVYDDGLKKAILSVSTHFFGKTYMEIYGLSDKPGAGSEAVSMSGTEYYKTLLCSVTQKVLDNDRIEYVLSFVNNERDDITMVTHGTRRVTTASYEGVQLQWYGTTGIANTYGSGFFHLRLVDSEHTERQGNVLPDSDTLCGPCIGAYSYLTEGRLKKQRRVGEFSIFNGGTHLSEVILLMGLVLREGEMRKITESTRAANAMTSKVFL